MNPYWEKCSPYLRTACSGFPHCHSHPYLWHAVDGKPVDAKSPGFAQFHWYLNVTVVFSYLAFVIFRTVQVCSDEAEPTLGKFYMGFVLQLYLMAAVANVTMVANKRDFIAFLRRYISFLENRGNKQRC